MVGLALLAWSYPRDGIRLFNVLAEFPSMENVLGRDEAAGEPFIEEELEVEDTLPELTPEELLDRQMEALQASRDSEFMAFCQKSPTRLHMPDDDVAYLDPVFEALDQAKERPLRSL